jgi:tetratricopeptide (TPR) repeat protein
MLARNFGGNGMIAGIVLALLLCWGLAAPLDALAVATADQGVVAQAQQELSRQNYEEALGLLTKAWQEGVRTPEAAFLLGRTYRAMLKYQDARHYLEEAVRLKPGYREAQLLLADTLVGLGQQAQAIPILKELEAAGYKPGHTAFILGLAYLKDKNYSQAAQFFHTAQQDPALAQTAKVQEALALAGEKRYRDAKKTMTEAIGLNPESTTAGFAQGYATVLDRQLKDYQRFRFNAYGGFDYDSNVSLQPGTSTGIVNPSGKNDVFWSLAAAAEYNIMQPGPFALWAFYGYYQNFHQKVTNYDLWSNTAGVVPSYTWSNSRFWVPCVFNYSDVGYQPYNTSWAMAPTYLYLLTPKIGVEGGMNLAYRNYWFPVFFDEDQRSGGVLGGTLAGYYFLKEQEGYVQLRFTYERNWTKGANWDSNLYRFGLAFLYPFTDRTRVRLTADFVLQPYDNVWFNGVPLANNPKRNDNIFIGGFDITHKIYNNWEINGHVYFVNDGSNVNLYNYNRVITGVQLGYRY